MANVWSSGGTATDVIWRMEWIVTEDLRTLLKRCLGGEQNAFQELIEQYRHRVVTFCRRLMGQHQDAEDVAQETFLRVCRHLHCWDENREFEPWLLAIAGNRCRTALAARRRRPIPQPLPELPTDEHQRNLAHRQLAEEVHWVLARMRPEYRRAFLLFHERQLEYTEIAAELGCPIGTVKTWVHRARRELIAHLQQREVLVADEDSNDVPAI